MTTELSYLASTGDALDARAPMLVAATSAAARSRATRWLEGAGWRAAEMAIEGALDRIGLQAAASGLWIEVEAGDSGNALDGLLSYANGEAAAGRMPTIVAAPYGMIDPVSARLDAINTQLLIDPDAVERTAALALARAGIEAPAMLHDIAHEPASRRLKQLSDEVGRIAATLARLSTGPEAPARTVERPVSPSGDVPPVSGETIRSVIRARRLRARFFDEELFADPAWDMPARPAPGRNRPTQGPGVVAVHRCRCARDHRASLDQDDDRQWPVQAPGRPPRRSPRVHRAGADDECRVASLFRRSRSTARDLARGLPPRTSTPAQHSGGC